MYTHSTHQTCQTGQKQSPVTFTKLVTPNWQCNKSDQPVTYWSRWTTLITLTTSLSIQKPLSDHNTSQTMFIQSSTNNVYTIFNNIQQNCSYQQTFELRCFQPVTTSSYGPLYCRLRASQLATYMSASTMACFFWIPLTWDPGLQPGLP